MYAYDRKPAQQPSIAVQKNSDPAFVPVDQRPEAITQLRLQELASHYVPPIQLKKTAINDDPQLEREADAMGAKALTAPVQAKSLKPAQPAANVVQAYRKQHDIKFSDNDLYRIDERQDHQLLVGPGAAPPEPQVLFKTNGMAGAFTIYEFDGTFSNECLDFAEYLATGKYHNNKAALHAKGDSDGGGKDRYFGTTDDQNIAIAEHMTGSKKRKSSFSQGKSAKPRLGEAYVTVRREVENNRNPFHAATVVAQDGTDNITCEADASDVLRAVPVFDMYAVPKVQKKKGKKKTVTKGKTFHDTNKAHYTTASSLEPTTGVLTEVI